MNKVWIKCVYVWNWNKGCIKNVYYVRLSKEYENVLNKKCQCMGPIYDMYKGYTNRY